jgi:nucleoside-diphosphate-sugar epimerase
LVRLAYLGRRTAYSFVAAILGFERMKLFLKILGGIVLLVVALVAFLLLSLRPTIPADRFELQPAARVGGLNVLVFGATGKLGYELVAQLAERGDTVTAFVRESSDRSKLEPYGVRFVVGDALDAASVQAAFAAGPYDAAITSVGAIRANPPPDYQGNANIFDAAVAAGVKRVIFVSTVGAGDSLDAAPLPSRMALSKVIPLKTAAEDHLKASGLDYTIVRPGGLPFGAGTGGGILSEDRTTMGFIVRSDLARLLIGVLDDPRTIGRTFAAVDPALKSPFDAGASE